MEPRQQAMIVFCLVVCVLSGAVGYAVWSNMQMKKSQVSVSPPQVMQVVQAPPPPQAPIITAPSTPPPKPKPATAQPVQPVTVAQLVQVYPGGWVWNPDWRHRFHRDHRWRHHDDELEWRWGRDHWDAIGREPWERPPIPPGRKVAW